MREWCSCGAAIRARRADVLVWRSDHRCSAPSESPLVPPQGGTSQVDIHQMQTWLGDDMIGFRPNPTR